VRAWPNWVAHRSSWTESASIDDMEEGTATHVVRPEVSVRPVRSMPCESTWKGRGRVHEDGAECAECEADAPSP